MRKLSGDNHAFFSTLLTLRSHETGHTFGAVHDCTSQTCSDGTTVNAQQCCPLSTSTCDAGEQYIMNPSTGQGITKFSPCSIGNICSAIGRNSVKTTCLTNNKGVTTISGQQCGNGIVEQGEDCDCGGTSGCGDDQCCDATTCKFKNGAVCDDSNEDCCKNCQLAANNTVCRASTSVCDPAETCTGSSPYCPADKMQPDGSSCGSGLQCASGQCTSRDQQCKTVMGSYTQGNDTYACDSINCQLSCASPQFGTGVCYGLQQNFLDGTPCGGGGKCENVSKFPFPLPPVKILSLSFIIPYLSTLLISEIPLTTTPGRLQGLLYRQRSEILDRRPQSARHRRRGGRRRPNTLLHPRLHLPLLQAPPQHEALRPPLCRAAPALERAWRFPQPVRLAGPAVPAAERGLV